MAEQILIGNVRGPAGISAYSSAIEGGFVGTEAEFYIILGSLKDLSLLYEQILGV